MKLRKKDFEEICENFDLGRFTSFKILTGGDDCENYFILTNKGKYVLKVLKDSHVETIERLKLEFEVLNFLKENKFNYEVPLPIKDKEKNTFFKKNNKLAWIYGFISGDIDFDWSKNFGTNNQKSPSKNKVLEVAKCMSSYHNIMKKFPVNQWKELDIKEIRNSLDQILKKELIDKNDLYLIDTLEEIIELLDNFKDFRINEDLLVCHADFHEGNLIYKEDKLLGVIDFENIFPFPKVGDIVKYARACLFEKGKLNKEKYEIFLNEYEKRCPLSKKEKDAVIPLIIISTIKSLSNFLQAGRKKVNFNRFLKWYIDTIKMAKKELKI